MLEEKEVVKGYWYFIYMKYQQLMKNLKWIRNSGFLSILNMFLAISVFHICFSLANASCCFSAVGTLWQTLHMYTHTCFPKSEELSIFFRKKKKAYGFCFYKQRKWKIYSIKNFVIKVKKKKKVGAELFNHWTCWLITLLSTALYHCRLIRVWSATAAWISSSASLGAIISVTGA